MSYVSLSLLDAVKGHPIQTWEFGARPLIRVGRGQDNDIVIGDPVVSRVHAEFVFETGGTWKMVSLGRNGTWVDGERVGDPVLIRDGTLVQLGSDGPWIEFHEGRPALRGGETIPAGYPSSLAMPEVDETTMRAEVSKIAEGEAFRDLQKQAQELKKSRKDREAR